MKAREFVIEARKKKPEPVPTTPADRAYDDLQSLHQYQSAGRIPGSYQLFMPRPAPSARARYEKHLSNVGSEWAYVSKDSPEIKPDYEKWADKHPDLIGEAAPIIATRGNVPPGDNKPSAVLWTSTAKKTNGAYTSDWVRWVSDNQPNWMSDVGYLYKVNPSARVLSLNSDYDADRVYRIFQNLGRGATAEFEPDARSYGQFYYLRKDFPWGEIAKHFDGVHHSFGGRRDNDFLYGWDCESTAWFNPDVLQLVGEVRIGRTSDED